MQEYIMSLAAAQTLLDFKDLKNKVQMERETHSIRDELRREIMLYGMLVTVWDMGHVVFVETRVSPLLYRL